MPDHFEGSKSVELNTGDDYRVLWLKFKPATASTNNDGAIPYGSTLNSYTVTIENAVSGVASSSSLIRTASMSSNKLAVYLMHSTAVDTGLYHLSIDGSFSISGTTYYMSKQFDFDRIYVR